MSDLDEYVIAQTKILEEIDELDKKSLTTLKDKIKRLREVTKPLVVAGYYPDKHIGHLCSIIREKLRPYQIPSIEQRAGWFYDLFDDIEREKNSDKMSQKINSLPIEKQTGIDDIDKLKTAQRNSEPLPDDYQYGIYLRKVGDSGNYANKQSESLLSKLEYAFYFIKKFDERYPNKADIEEEIRVTGGKRQRELQEQYDHYLKCEDIIKSIESGIGTTQDKIDAINEILSVQKFNSKQIDERSKITFLEKWNIIVCQIQLGISAIAKKLGINKKHCTNNIRPTHNPVTGTSNKHHEYINWFRAMKWICPCGRENIADCKSYFDEQIERGKLNIPFKPMILKNCDVE